MRIYRDNHSGHWKCQVSDMPSVIVNSRLAEEKAARRFFKDCHLGEVAKIHEMGAITQDVVTRLAFGKSKLTLQSAALGFNVWMRESTKFSPNTVRMYNVFVSAFLKHCGLWTSNPLVVTQKEINAYLNQPSKSGYKTRELWYCAMVLWFDWMRDSGWIRGNPVRLASIDKSRLTHTQKEPKVREPFTEEEVKKLLEASKGMRFWHAAILFAWKLGLRRCDVYSLEWASISQDRAIVWTMKNDRRIDNPLDDELRAELVSLRDTDPIPGSGKIFPYEDCSMPGAINGIRFLDQFNKIMAKAGIPKGKSFHCLRHTAITNTINHKGLEMARVFAGHGSARMTAGYYHSPKAA